MIKTKEKLVCVHSGVATVGKSMQRLTDENIECEEVWLSLWNYKLDGFDTEIIPGDVDSFPIFYGFKGFCAHQLNSNETVKNIPVANAQDIFVRMNKNGSGTRQVFYSCFKRVEVRVHDED